MTQDKGTPGRALARTDIEAVIRRATELTLSEADAREAISEDELVNIAAELGLPTQHVRQAIFERPTLQPEPRWHDRWFGSPIVAESRAVGARADVTLRSLEHYLCTREYLQIVRRRPHELALMPAEDAISRVARLFTKARGGFTLARAERVVLAVHPLEADRSHVRIETDFGRERGSFVGVGTTVGGLLGLAAGGIAEALLGWTGGFALGAGVAAGGITGIRIAGHQFRARLALARRELAHLLDRVETGQRPEPPPPPWRRNLQERLFGRR